MRRSCQTTIKQLPIERSAVRTIDTSLRLQAEVSTPVENLMNAPSVEVNLPSIATSRKTARNRLLNVRTRCAKIQTRNSPGNQVAEAH